MASPLSRGLFHRAIGESGAFFGNSLSMKTREQAEKAGVAFAESAFQTSSLQALRAKPAQELLDAALKPKAEKFTPDVDGYFLPADCGSIYSNGKQSHISLLAGWNQDEGNFESFFGEDKPSVENYVARAKTQFGSNADAFLKLYPATTDAQAKRAAQDLDGDLFIAYSTWKWLELQLKTGEFSSFSLRVR